MKYAKSTQLLFQNVLVLQPVMNQRHRLVYSNLKSAIPLGLGANVSGAPLADYTILSLFAHQVDGTIVTPRQINLWRLEGGKRSNPLFRLLNNRCSLFFSTKPCFYLHFSANTRHSKHIITKRLWYFILFWA